MFHPPLNVEKWTTDNVAVWIQGLDSAVSKYHTNFREHGVNGRRLCVLDHSDLTNIGIAKIGNQEAILEVVELLLNTDRELDANNLQRLALIVNCRISNLHQMLEVQENYATVDKRLVDSVCFLVKSLKDIICWLEKPPFSILDDYIVLRQHLLKATLTVINGFTKSSQQSKAVGERRSQLLDKLADIEKKCRDLIENSLDPLVITPASVESITIKKKADESLGLQISSTGNGIHTIKMIRKNTASDQVNRLELGDEIIQVNNQAVIGWQLKNVVAALKEKPKEVVLSVKKHPRHFNPNSIVQRRPSPQAAFTLGEDLKQNTLPKRISKHFSGEISSNPSNDRQLKSSSISEGTTPSPSTQLVSDASSTYDDVFSPSTDTELNLKVYEEVERRSTVSGGMLVNKVRPTILVDMWDNPAQNEPVAGSSSASKIAGKKEILSTFHVVKSTPELRTPDTEPDSPVIADID